jgi:hypothetical protein
VEASPAETGLAGPFRKILLEKQSCRTHEKIKGIAGENAWVTVEQRGGSAGTF